MVFAKQRDSGGRSESLRNHGQHHGSTILALLHSRMRMKAEQEWKGKVKNDEDEDVQLPSSLSIQAEWDKPLIQ